MIEIKTIKIKAKGMHCKSCEMLVNDALKNTNGVKSVSSNAKTNIIQVTFDESKTTPETLVKVVSKEGFK